MILTNGRIYTMDPGPRVVDNCSQFRGGLYDGLYVALAERESCEFVTDDQKRSANLTRFASTVPLASLPGRSAGSPRRAAYPPTARRSSSPPRVDLTYATRSHLVKSD